MLLMENPFSRHSWHAASRNPQPHFPESHSIHQKTKPFRAISRFSLLLNSWFIALSPVARALHQRNAPYGKLFLQIFLARCLKKTTHSSENKTLSCISGFSRLKNKQTCTHVAVIKLVVHSSLASCPGSSPKECSFWKTPSPDTLWRAASRKPHIYQKTKPFRVFRG